MKPKGIESILKKGLPARVAAVLLTIFLGLSVLPAASGAVYAEGMSDNASQAPDMLTLRFDLGGGAAAEGYIGVSAACGYSKARGYGFANTEAVSDVVLSGQGTCADAVLFDPEVSGHMFNVDLKPGVYRISVTTGSVVSTSITAEGQTQLFFMTGDYAADSFTIPVTDGQLNIYPEAGISGTPFSLSEIVIEQVSSDTVTKPTIWIAGDETTARFYNVPDDAMQGWGQYLSAYIDSDRYEVRNVSIDGVDAAAVLFGGPFQTVSSYGKSGDILILAVGLNDYLDAQRGNPAAPDCTEYVSMLTEMVRGAKALGMKVYLVKQHGSVSDFSRYPIPDERWFFGAIDRVAAAEGAEILDIFHPWLTYCLENNHGGARDCYFADELHLNASGARGMAQLVAKLMFPEPEEETSVPDYSDFDAPGTITYQTDLAGGPVKNPHKGFVMTTYEPYMIDSTDGYEYGIGGAMQNGAWDVVTICNGALYWKDINPQEDVYRWDEIDSILEACWAHGMTYVIRILPYSHLVGSNDNYGAEHDFVPEWVYKNGAAKKRVRLADDPGVELDVPDWGSDEYIKACKKLASALAKRYDGDPRVEVVDIRPFGNWGEWHFAQVIGSDMPPIDVQKDMIRHYAEAFRKTTVAITSDAYGEVYEYALSLGVTKRNDGMIGLPNEEWDMRKTYYANLPGVAENAGTYKMMKANSNAPMGPLKWTPTRFRECIEIGHLSIMALDQDSHCSYEFYQEQKEIIDAMCNRIGYNYTVTSAKRNGNRLLVTIRNTGVAPSFFNIDLCAEITDADGKKLGDFGKPVRIERGSFRDETEQTFLFTCEGKLPADANICLAMYECDNELLKGKDPTVRFDNRNNLPNNRLLLAEQNRDYLVEGYSLVIEEGSFLLNIYTDLSETYRNHTLRLTLPNGTVSDTRVGDAKTVSMNGRSYRVFTASVAAKDITSRITIKLCDADDNAVGGAVWTSVEEYALALKKRDSRYEAFVDAMLTYGQYARAYFDDVNRVPYSFIKEYSGIDYAAIAEAIEAGAGVGQSGYIGSSLLLENKVILRHYFSEPVAGAVYKDALYYVEQAFNPTEFDRTFGGYDYSVNDYIRLALKSEVDRRLKNLVSALYEYEMAAKGL